MSPASGVTRTLTGLRCRVCTSCETFLRWSTIVDGALASAIARAHDEVVIDFVDHHLEDAISAGHRAGRETTRSEVKRHLPPFVEELGEAHLDKAHELHPYVQRVTGVVV